MVEINETSETHDQATSTGAACPYQPGSPQVCGDTLWQPPQLDFKFFAITTVLVAALVGLSFWQIPSSLIVWCIIALTWLFGCPRTKRATLQMVGVIYLPFIWIFVIPDIPDLPTHQYLISAFGHCWGSMPAALIGYSWTAPQESLTLINILAAALTVLFFLTTVTWVRFWPAWRWPVLMAAALLSISVSIWQFVTGISFLPQ